MTADRPLQGRVALVTGGVRRIGRATAFALGQDGAAIVINARSSRAEADALAAELGAAGIEAMVHLADVTDEAAVAGMIEAIRLRFGRLDILVNNAANRQETPFLEMTLDEWHSITRTILDGAFLCTRAALPLMIEAGGGTIVNVGGLTAHTGASDRAHVVTAKAGLVGLTKAVAVEFGKSGITANCVVPGKIGGPRSETSGTTGGALPEGAGSLVGRMGEPDDVAAAIRFLALPRSRYITGQTLHVNGGLFLP